MAPPRKPRERRQRRGTKDLDDQPVAAVEVVESPSSPAKGGAPIALAPSRPDRGWLKTTKDDWDEYWSSDIARHLTETDRPALKRLFRLRDQLVRAQTNAVKLRKQAMAQPTVLGSMGQTVANPLFRAADSASAEALALEPRIVALEDRLGLSPRARLALGIAEATGHNLAGQNQLMVGQLLEALSAHDPRSAQGDPAAAAG
jgi:hypothetical protein